jgi:hypothetical protein
MGVDATLFARKARRAVYLDRLHYWRPDDDKAESVYGKLRSQNAANLATAVELESLCRTLITEEAADTVAGADPNRNQKTWLWEVCIRFAQEHPDDEFFIVTDHDWPDSHDIAKRGSYVVWDPYYGDDKLAPWHPGYVEPTYDPPPPLTPERQARQAEDLRLLVKALESGPMPGEMTGSALVIEDLSPVMHCVTYTIPSRRRTLRESLRYINYHWFNFFTEPRQFWWRVRNEWLPLNFTKIPGADKALDDFAKKAAEQIATDNAAAGTALPAEPTQKPLRVISNVLVLHLDDVLDDQGERFDPNGLCYAPDVAVSKNAGSNSLDDIIGAAKLRIGAGGHLYADITIYPFVVGPLTVYPSVVGAARERDGNVISQSVIRSLALTSARNCDKRIAAITIPE